jgi:hypothetical protein
MTLVPRQKTWLATLVALLALGFAAQVQAQAANTIVLAQDEALDARLLSRLRAELGLRSLSLVTAPGLTGASLEARQEAAQLRAASAEAHATLWIEARQVHALAADGTHRYAVLPRPLARVSPRVFAVIAMSALDELNIVVPVQPLPVEPTPNEEAVASPTESPTTEAPPPSEAPPSEAPPSEVPIEAPPIEAPPIEAPPTQEVGTLDLSSPIDDATLASDVRDGEVHGYFALDGMVGAVWNFSARSNIAHIVQRLTGGLQWELLRAEFSGSFGLEQGIDGSYEQSLMGDFVFFVGAGIPLGEVSLDVGALGGLALHGLVEASTPRSGDILTSGRLGGAFGISTPDANSALVFRARIELGLFARLDPGLGTLFTNVFLGIGFR